MSILDPITGRPKGALDFRSTYPMLDDLSDGVARDTVELRSRSQIYPRGLRLGRLEATGGHRV